MDGTGKEKNEKQTPEREGPFGMKRVGRSYDLHERGSIIRSYILTVLSDIFYRVEVTRNSPF